MDDRAGRASEAATAATWMPEAGRLGSGDRGDVDDRGRARLGSGDRGGVDDRGRARHCRRRSLFKKTI